ncbi:MAG: hypothetical protein J6M22_06265 [Firmicutes bacterium]|nr:hypothetical protein [Bacillota bacterium]
MILTELICDQVRGVTVMFGAGIAVAFMYQLFLWVCSITVRRGWLEAILEIAFWAGAAAFAGKFLYYCAHGQISVHTICAFACGAILWKFCFYDIIYSVCTFFETKFGIRKKHGKKEKKQSI